VAFASLLVFAVATTFFAGWGVFTSSASISAGPAIYSTANSTYATSSGIPASVNASEGVSSVTTVTTTTSTFSTTSVSSESASASTTPQVESTVTNTETVTSTIATVAGSSTTVSSAVAGAVTTSVTGALSSLTTTQATGSQAGSFTFGPASSSQSEALLREVQGTSLILAPVCWILLGGAWVWRGRVRSRYTEMGFGSDVFELFMKMKGGATRIKVLNTLSTPKDRLQLAQELGVDWKTVDRHVQILNRYGFVREQAAYGTVRLYEVTPIGRMLLNLFDDLEKTDGPVAQHEATAALRSEDESR